MTLVTIVAAPLPDNSGLDVDRLEKVEDLHPEIARNMLQYGTAREPSDEELAAYHTAQQPEAGDHDEPSDVQAEPAADVADAAEAVGADSVPEVAVEQPAPARAPRGNGKTQPAPDAPAE